MENEIPFEQTPEALRQRFSLINPDWNKRPDWMEPRDKARERIQSRAWNLAEAA